jgi:hypothetical protein
MASQNNAITLYSDFDPALINFEPIARNKRGGKVCYLSYGPSKQRIYLQTPPNVSCPFGVGIFEDEKTGDKSYSIDIAFRDLQTDPKMKKFYDKMLEINNVVLARAVERSTEWFGKTMSKDVVREFYRPLVKDPKDQKYSPTMKIKIPMANGVPVPDIYSEAREKVALDYITKGSTLRCLLELRTVWFVNKNFGVTWQLVQTGVTSRPQKFVGYAFKEDEEDEGTTGGGYDFTDDAPNADDF